MFQTLCTCACVCVRVSLLMCVCSPVYLLLYTRVYWMFWNKSGILKLKLLSRIACFTLHINVKFCTTRTTNSLDKKVYVIEHTALNINLSWDEELNIFKSLTKMYWMMELYCLFYHLFYHLFLSQPFSATGNKSWAVYW